MTDIWVCGNCHSINRQRDDRCYKCGERQLEVATGALEDTRVQTAREIRRVYRFESTLPFAIAAVGLLLAVGVLGVVVLVVSLPAILFVRDSLPQLLQTGAIDQSQFVRLMGPTIIPSALHLGASILCLIAVGLWLYRVILNIPTLGGGIPDTPAWKAFVYTIIPGVNLAKVPPLIQDVLYRVEPRKGGFFMVLLAWFGLVGSRFISFGVNWWAGGRMAQVVFEAEDLDQAIRMVSGVIDVTIWTELLTAAMSAAGAIVLAGVIVRYESRAKARDEEIQAAGPPLPPPVQPVLVDAAAVPALAGAPGAPAPTAGTSVRPIDAAPPAIDTTATAAAGTTAAPATPLVRPTTPAQPAPAAPQPQPTAPTPPTPATATPPAPVAEAAPPAVSFAPPPPPAPGSGPSLLVALTPDGMTVQVDGSDPEPTSLEELIAAAPALAKAGGTATIEARDAGEGTAARVAAVAAALQASGVPTQTA